MSWSVYAKTAEVDRAVGKRQIDGGFSGAEFDGIIADTLPGLSEGIVTLGSSDGTTVNVDLNTIREANGHDKSGAQIEPNVNIAGIRARLGPSVSGASRAYVYDSSTGDLLNSVSIVGVEPGGTFTIIADLEAGKAYNLVVDAEGSRYTFNNFLGATYPYTSGDINIINGARDSTSTGSLLNIVSVQALHNTITAGKVTKTITVGAELYEYQNLYYKTNKPPNTTITCNILDADGNILMSDVADGDSLRGIDASIHRTIKAEWALSRNSVSNLSPELFAPFWTWFGAPPPAPEPEPFIVVKSVQRGTVNLSGSSTSVIVPVSSVDISKTVLHFSNTTSNSGLNSSLVRGELLDDTNIEFFRGSGGTGSGTQEIAWQLVEYA